MLLLYNTKNRQKYNFLSNLEQGYKDSNLEMTESESDALPFGDSPISNPVMKYTLSLSILQVLIPHRACFSRIFQL